MMNKATALQMWDLLRQRHGIAMRVIAGLPADQLDSHPIPNMRTPKELVVHMYDVCIRGIALGVERGEITDTEKQEKAIAAGIKTRDELLEFARDSWDAATQSMNTITDAHLQAEVKTPWGMNFPGWMALGITNDEFLHHRGQLYAFSRALGAEPPMMWDFAKNEPAYQPKTAAMA